jgi:hypothetical protein
VEPVTMILGALALGAAAGVTEVAKTAVGDAYRGLKRLVLRAFKDDKVAQASLTMFESDPTQPAYVTALGEHLERHQVTQDDQVLGAAQNLLRVAGPSAAGQGSIAASVANVWANHGSVAGGVISGNVTIQNQGPGRELDPGSRRSNPPVPDQE